MDDDQAVASLRPPTREQNPKQSIPKAKARTTSSAALEHGDLMAQRDRFQQQRSEGSRFAARGPPRMMRLSRSPSLAGYRQPIKTINQFARIKL
jgi:hypothetical protein